MRLKKPRRWIWGALLFAAGVAAIVGRPAYLIVNAWRLDRPADDESRPGYVDDASRLNATRVAEVWDVPTDPAAAEAQLRDLLRRARQEGRKVSIAGARHSMGGHTIYPDGVVLNMLPFAGLELDEGGQTLRVGAGARWSDVIPYLDARGRSVAIMQSNNAFSVGGSLSVNCHGWQHNRPPIASTVQSFRLMTADGTIVRCSRAENAELFSLVLGGYGLFGVMLDVELRVVPNERYRPEVETIPAERYVVRFREKVDGATDAGMVYGRLCVVPGRDTFLREAMLTVFRRSPAPGGAMPALHAPGFTGLRREVYRAQIGSDAGKELRWGAEKRASAVLTRRFFSRNQLLNEGVEVYQERGADQTDILHEYFVPPEKVNDFLEEVRAVVPRHRGDLLNVTVRNVLADGDAFLRYADQDVFAFVMLFSQPRTPDGEAGMEAMTQELVEAALRCGGRYYLPYRLHATPEQFGRAYPQGRDFFARKRRYDPDELFQNQFYLKYGRAGG
jgi:FAD/FMN-containing dehydrogenase